MKEQAQEKSLLSTFGIPVALFIIVAFLGFGAYKMGERRASNAAITAPPCTAPADGSYLCPNDDFYADYLRWKKLKTEKTASLDEPAVKEAAAKSDQLDGMTARLVREFPAGYTWSEEKLHFVKVPPPPAPFAPAATPATPAPAAATPPKK